MNKIYKDKYFKYKNKYLKLKNKYGGTPEKYPIGINFESGKIINHIITKYCNCKGWANCQIAMDAPFGGRVADEEIRKKGPSEKSFEDYDEEKLILNLEKILTYIKNTYGNITIVIQIARGRAAEPMFLNIIKPILEKLDIDKEKYIVKYGYRTTDYYNSDLSEDFIFINIGMFAVLTNIDEIYVGELCNPVQTWNILNYLKEEEEEEEEEEEFKFEYEDTIYNWETNPNNILSNIDGCEFKKIKLFGITDEMKFITPTEYNKTAIDKLIDYANKES